MVVRETGCERKVAICSGTWNIFRLVESNRDRPLQITINVRVQ